MRQDYVHCATKEGYHHIAYTEWGTYTYDEEHPSAVVCVHGLTRNSRDFDALAAFLSTQANRHVFCPDVVGRGDSSWLKDPHGYTFERYIMDMNVLIARTAATHIDWIGTSMGGLIGIMLAALPHSPIRSLVLNDVSPQVPIHALWEMAKYVGKDPEFSSKNQAKEHYKKIYAEFGPLTDEQWDYFTEHSIKEISPNVYISKFDPNIHDFRLTWQSVKEFFYNPHKALEGVFFDVDLWSIWQNVKCPVLVIRGAKSSLLLPEHVKRMQRTHSHVDLFEVENAGHAPALLDHHQQEKIAVWLHSVENSKE